MKPLKIYKFGGASIQDAPSMARIRGIIASALNQFQLVVVVSALGKSTNALEKVVLAWHQNQSEELQQALEFVAQTHRELISDLDISDRAKEQIRQSFDIRLAQLEVLITASPHPNYNLNYDQVVSFGELFSTTIFCEYLVLSGLQARFQDVREWIITEEPFREARIVWEETEKVLQPFVQHPNSLGPLTITQGFIGSVRGTELTSTLGREGSDYTGAILASVLNAKSLTIWKDVAGVMNADPRLFPNAIKFDVLSYREAIEMTSSVATVIHPKTIKPLENKGIPLEVNSFLRPDFIGTIVSADAISIHHTPCYIVVKNQILLSISSKDFSFIAEPGLSAIFQAISEVGLRVRLMQNSAISFSVVLDNDAFKIPGLLQSLKEKFRVKFNENVELWTIRHYTPEVIQSTTEGKTILMEQRNRETAQFVMETK